MIVVDIRSQEIGQTTGEAGNTRKRVKFFKYKEAYWSPHEKLRPYWLQVGDVVVLNNGYKVRIIKIFYEDNFLRLNYQFTDSSSDMEIYSCGVEVFEKSAYGID